MHTRRFHGHGWSCTCTRGGWQGQHHCGTALTATEPAPLVASEWVYQWLFHFVMDGLGAFSLFLPSGPNSYDVHTGWGKGGAFKRRLSKGGWWSSILYIRTQCGWEGGGELKNPKLCRRHMCIAPSSHFFTRSSQTIASSPAVAAAFHPTFIDLFSPNDGEAKAASGPRARDGDERLVTTLPLSER